LDEVELVPQDADREQTETKTAGKELAEADATECSRA
jgi:hypothetical protein